MKGAVAVRKNCNSPPLIHSAVPFAVAGNNDFNVAFVFKAWEDLTIQDDFMFKAVMKSRRTNLLLSRHSG